VRTTGRLRVVLVHWLRYEVVRSTHTHLISVIRVDELIIVDTVCGVAFHALDCRLARVEGNDVVD
jgi:hypothetical protein